MMLSSVLSVKLSLDRLFAVEFNAQQKFAALAKHISVPDQLVTHLYQDKWGLFMSPLPCGWFWRSIFRLSPCHIAENPPNCSKSSV